MYPHFSSKGDLPGWSFLGENEFQARTYYTTSSSSSRDMTPAAPAPTPTKSNFLRSLNDVLESSDESEVICESPEWGPDCVEVEPELVVYCTELVSKYEPSLCPDEYLTFQLSKRTQWQEHDLLTVTEMFLGVIDEESILSAFIRRFKSSSFNTVQQWDDVELVALKVMALIYFRWSRRIHPCDQFAVYIQLGVPLAISYYEFVVSLEYSELRKLLTKTYSPEYVDKQLAPNAYIGRSVLNEVLMHIRLPIIPKEKPREPKTTKVEPFKFQSDRPKATSVYKKSIPTDEELRRGSVFQAQRVPSTTYEQPEINKRLEDEFARNRVKSLYLLEAARRFTLTGLPSKRRGHHHEIEEGMEPKEFSDEEAFELEDEEEATEAERNADKHQELEKSPSAARESAYKKGKGFSKKSIAGKDSITEEHKSAGRRRSSVDSKVKTKSFHSKATPSNHEKPLSINMDEDEEEKVENEEIESLEGAFESGTGLNMEQGQEEEEMIKEYEGDDDGEQNIAKYQLGKDRGQGVISGNAEAQKQDSENGETRKMKRMVLSQVLKEPAFRGGHTFASAIRLQKLFQLKDDEERAELDKLITLHPTVDALEEGKLAREEAEARAKRLESIRMAVTMANEAAQKSAIKNKRKANRVRKEAANLRQEQAAKKRLELEQAKKVATWVKQIEANAVLKMKLCKQVKRDEIEEWKKRTNDLLTQAKEEAALEERVRQERIQRIKADVMFNHRPVVIKNPFHARKNEMSDAEAQLRLEIIRRKDEAKRALLREKIKNEKEERAAKFKRALEEIAERQGKKQISK